MLVSVDVLLTEAPMSGDRTRFYRTCKKIRSSPYIEKILRAVRIMVRKYENGMVVFFIVKGPILRRLKTKEERSALRKCTLVSSLQVFLCRTALIVSVLLIVTYPAAGCCCSSFWADMPTPLNAWVLVKCPRPWVLKKVLKVALLPLLQA